MQGGGSTRFALINMENLCHLQSQLQGLQADKTPDPDGYIRRCACITYNGRRSTYPVCPPTMFVRGDLQVRVACGLRLRLVSVQVPGGTTGSRVFPCVHRVS